MSLEESLRSLELLLHELYSPSCSNERRRDITNILSETMYQKDAWRMSLAFLEKSRSTTVCMYCFNVLEYCLKNDWFRLTALDRRRFADSVEGYLVEARTRPSEFDNILVKKATVLYVRIARADWPHDMPDFHVKFNHYLSNPMTVEFGFSLIETMSQEMVTACDDVSGTRRCELRDLFGKQLPDIMQHISQTLDGLLSERSPHYDARFHCVAINLPPRTSSLLSLMKTVLRCLLHLFSWIPLSDLITSQLLSSIFRCSVMGCLPLIKPDEIEVSGPVSKTAIEEIGVSAMNCINELMERNCVPPHFEAYLLEMFRQTYNLLEVMTNEEQHEETSCEGCLLTKLSAEYLGKFTEFLQLFMSVHFRRFESNEKFPVTEFLELLRRYTALQMFVGLPNYFSCLSVWNSFLEFIQLQIKSNENEKQQFLSRYKPVIAALTYEIFWKSQFSFNQTFLDELEDEDVEVVQDMSDDQLPEFRLFLRESFETLALIGQLFPDELLGILEAAYIEKFNSYLAIDPASICAREHRMKKLHCLLRDLASLMQLLGRISEHFLGESNFLPRVELAASLFDKLLLSAEFAVSNELFKPSDGKEAAICRDFTNMHAENLAGLAPFAAWLGDMLTRAKGNSDFQTFVDGRVPRLLALIETAIFRPNVPARIVVAGSQLLLALCANLRYPLLLASPAFEALYEKCAAADQCLGLLPFPAVLNLYRSVSSYLVIDWVLVRPDQDNCLSQRAHLHKALVAPFVRSCSELEECSQEKLCLSLHILIAMLEELDGAGGARSRRTFAQSIDTLIAGFPSLIRFATCEPSLCHLALMLVKSVARVLLNQVDKAHLELMARVLFGLFDEPDSLTRALQAPLGTEIINCLLDVFQLLASRQITARSSLPDILHLVCGTLHPKLFEFSAIECLVKLYELLRSILLASMSFFFKTQRHGALDLSKKPTAGEQRPTEECLRPDEFRAVMGLLAQSFMHPNLETFAFNLQTLRLIHERFAAFRFAIFREEMMLRFLSIFVNDLIISGHDSLKEEIYAIIHELALSNWDLFHHDYLPTLTCAFKGLNNEQIQALCFNFDKSEDSPSFAQNLVRYVGDAKYFMRCNSNSAAALAVIF